jgi:hypothetical protein
LAANKRRTYLALWAIAAKGSRGLRAALPFAQKLVCCRAARRLEAGDESEYAVALDQAASRFLGLYRVAF